MRTICWRPSIDGGAGPSGCLLCSPASTGARYIFHKGEKGGMPGREPGDEDIDCTSKSSSRKFVPRNSGGSSSSKLRPAGFVATRGISEAGEGRGLQALRQR